MRSPTKRMFLILLVLIGFNPLPGVQFSFGQQQHHPQPPPPPPPPPQRLLVPMTIVPNASSLGAVCLDGSPPAYHLHPGSGSGVHNWLLQFEGGGWCNDVASCLERSKTRRGSTTLMNKLEVFSGILSNDPAMNPGCSAGGLATFLHCDDLAQLIPPQATIKCMSDAGFFLDVRDISGNSTVSPFFQSVVKLQGVQKNLQSICVSSQDYPFKCFFPQYALPYIRTPYFILNSAYDTYQFNHIFVPPSADPRGRWNHCKLNPDECTTNQINVLQGFRGKMLSALRLFGDSVYGGMFINSCFAHCQSELQDTWLAPDSPRVHNKSIAKAVGDWYFERNVSKEVDCPYPCNFTCHNLLPPDQDAEKKCRSLPTIII